MSEPHPYQRRVDVIDRITARMLPDASRYKLLRERRTLIRIIHNIPQQIQLPLDWQL